MVDNWHISAHLYNASSTNTARILTWRFFDLWSQTTLYLLFIYYVNMIRNVQTSKKSKNIHLKLIEKWKQKIHIEGELFKTFFNVIAHEYVIYYYLQ